jgi:hypothetical protein
MTGTTQAYQRAITKAQQNGGALAAEPVEFMPNTYRVRSASDPGTYYVVNVTRALDFYCTCPAGKHDCPCWHCASVWLCLVAEGKLRRPGRAPAAVGRAAASAYFAALDDGKDTGAAFLAWRKAAGR